MKLRARFAILVLIPLGCATGENAGPGGAYVGAGAGGTASDGASGTASGTSGTTTTTAGTDSVLPGTSGSGDTAGTGGSGGSGFGGTSSTAGSFSTSGSATAGTFGTAGTGGTSAGTSSGGAAGTNSGGTSAGNGAAGKSTGGAAGSSAGGTSAGTSGTGPVGAYCDNQTKLPLPYTVNDGFQPSGWQGDITALSVPTGVVPDGCAVRVANAVGICTVWRFTPNAAAPAWSGVTWSKMWDAQYTHPPICLATGATKVMFQARGAQGGEVVTFSAAGAAETPFTLTNAWKAYSISLVGVTYDTAVDGVDSGFFWKVAPPTPAGAPVTFFIDDIKFSN